MLRARLQRLFAMVRDMYDLQVTAENQSSPVLTLPVGTGR